ncbi:APC family permease [Pseudonocardia spinosispora]|uniref:APC family permease n=1 Tax=Pseudonocardia spinosispora TaxID=103441 RepID=UPI00048C5EBF|nr:APC family permease [Pseudonocardia spinosispora]
MTAILDSGQNEDAKLRKTLGYWSLVATGLGSVIGSGWLFSAMYAAQSAGPASLIAWVIGGLLMLAVALVFAELGIAHPESGGLVRYPLYSNGRFAASIVGWSMWVCYLGNPPTEAAGVLQYASSYIPGLYQDKQLTGLGIGVAIVLMAIFVAINYFGVELFARTNNVVTAIKVLIPTATVVLLIASGFDSTNITGHGGFAPYGYGAALSTIATAGMMFAYTGFRNIVELSGEVKNPRKHIPAALVTTILTTIVLYLGLQVAFLGAVPSGMLGAGWHGVNFDSPFAQLAMLLGLSWLYWTLIADSMLSPSGAGICYTACNARNAFGLAKNGFFPSWVRTVNERWGVPTRALILNFVVGMLFLLPLPSWHKIVGVTGTLVVFTFSIGSVSLLAFRRTGVTTRANQLPGLGIISPIAFVVSALVIYWVDWPTLAETIPIVVAGLVWYAVTWVRQRHGFEELRGGLWLLVYLAFLYAMSSIGSFEGVGLIKGPWDSLIVAVVAMAIYFWGTASGTAYLRAHPDVMRRVDAPDPS